MLTRTLLFVLAFAALGVADEKDEIKSLHEELAKRHKELDELKQLVQKAMAVNRELQDDNARLRNELVRAGAKQAEFKTRLDAIAAREEEMRRMLTQAKATNEKMAREIEAATKINRNNREWIERIWKKPGATWSLVRHILPVAIRDYRDDTRRYPPMGAALWTALSDAKRARPLRVRDLPDAAMLKDGAVLDSWDNPVVYIDKNNYGKPMTVQTKRGPVTVHARKKDNGVFFNPTSYQLRSFGPNGVPDDIDDIHR